MLSTSEITPAATKKRRAPFLIVGAVILAALVGMNILLPQFFDSPLPTRVQDGLTLALSVLIESLPFVVLGVVLSIAVQRWIPAGTIERVLPKAGWARRMALSLLGVVFPVCECGNVPFARGLIMRGFTPAEALTFLIAAPIVNPIVIITTHAAFGWDSGILLMRIIGGFVIANLIGWLFSRHPQPEAILTTRFTAQCERAAADTRPRSQASIVQFVVELRAVMPALIIGSGLAGAIQVLVPRDALLAIGTNPVYSILAMTVLAITVAICSNVDSFFALSFASAFTPGSLVVFLLVGPLIDVKMLALMRTTFSTKALVVVSVVVLLASFAIGVGVNLVA